MDNEVPCRDTDPVNMNLVNRTAETMAFTVDFGQQDINQEEKVKKFERFAQRSSLRRVNSPRQKESEKVCEENKTNNNNNGEAVKKSPAFTKSSPVTKERRSTVVLERSPGGRSVSHSRLGARGAATARKSSGNEDALSHTGTYTMDSEEQDNKKDLPNVSSVDKALYVADWTAKISQSQGSESSMAAARRRLPSAPSKDEVTDESLKEVERILARSELPGSTATTTSNIRPGYKPSIKPLIDNNLNGSTSYRSLPYSTNYGQSRVQESAAARASVRRKPLTSSSSSHMVTRTGAGAGPGNRSNSCLTSAHSDYQAWRQARRQNTESSAAAKKLGPGGSVTSSCNSSSSSQSSAPGKQGASKLLGRLSQSMMANMKRSASFHHENQQSQAAKESEPRTYRTSDDYYLDEDELFLPLYTTEEEPVEARPARKDQLSALDSLVINTSHNVSSKLCLAAADLLRSVSGVPGVEEDVDTSINLETVTFLLEDSSIIQNSHKNKMSQELAATLKNLKKLEQAFDVLNKVLGTQEDIE